MANKTDYSAQHDSQERGIVKLAKVMITCPACEETVESVARDNIVSGYCAKIKKYIKVILKEDS